MKKFTGLASLFSVLLFIAMASSAFAGIDRNGVTMFMTDNNSAIPTSSQTTFALSETPYLFIGFPSSFSNLWKSDASLWKNPDGLIKGFTVSPFANTNNWYTISNWDRVKTTGLWKVDAGYLGVGFFNVKSGGEALNFKVVPEPFSSALFLLGGGALALGAYRRRSTKKSIGSNH